jgi:cell division transport system ATP-binding protein
VLAVGSESTTPDGRAWRIGSSRGSEPNAPPFPYPLPLTRDEGPDAVIRFDQVSKRYEGGHEALSQLSFELAAGEMAFVTGHSGAGKSTLLKLIALIERPSHGQIVVDGQSLAKVGRGGIPALRRRLGMVFQDHRLLMDRSVFANVELPLKIGAIAPAERSRRVRAALEKVGLLAYERQLPASLSTGEQQRVGIARAIVARPAVLIADEPTGNLDPQLAVEIMGLFAEFQDAGTTVLVASHDLPLIKRMKKRVVVLDHGRLVADIAAQEVL